jgi:septin 7
MQEERVLHEAKLAKMEAEMKMVFQQKVQEKEAKLKQSEEELYARHKEMKDALDKQRADLEDKKRKIESGRPLTPEKTGVRKNRTYTTTLFANILRHHSRGRRVSFVLECRCRFTKYAMSMHP